MAVRYPLGHRSEPAWRSDHTADDVQAIALRPARSRHVDRHYLPGVRRRLEQHDRAMVDLAEVRGPEQNPGVDAEVPGQHALIADDRGRLAARPQPRGTAEPRDQAGQ